MAEKFTGKEKKGKHEAGRVILNKRELEYKGAEPPIEPPPTKKGKK